MSAFASLNFRFSRMLAGLLLAGLLLVAAVATWLIASGPAPRATGPAPPTRAGTVRRSVRTVHPGCDQVELGFQTCA